MGIKIVKGLNLKLLDLFSFILNLWFEKSTNKQFKNIDYLNDS